MNSSHLSNIGPRPFYVFSLVILLVSMTQQSRGLIPVSQESTWSTPQTIPGYHPETWPPILIADQNRTVHAFSSQWIGNSGEEPIRAIVYNKWTFENGWTDPVDILMSPVKEARLTDVHLDGGDNFHITFFGGDNTGANTYYSKAPAALAGDARAWSAPLIIGGNAGDPEGAAIVEDDQGTLFVVYSSRQSGNSLYVVTSRDGGEIWSFPTPIFFTRDDAPYISELQVIRSKSGWLHGIWAVNTGGGQGRGIYYVRSQDGNEWREPVLLAAAHDGLGTQVPAIFEYKDTLFALYITQINEHNKMVMRQSHDGGETWSDQSMIFPRHEGVNGLLSLVTDGNNQLHLFFGQRISGDPTVHGMWHSMYLNNRWIEPEGVVRGFKVLDTVGFDSFDPNSPRAIVSQGNVILVTWRTDPGSKGNGVWFSYKKIDAPEQPIAQLSAPPTPADNPVVSSEPTVVGDFPVVTPSRTNRPLDDALFDNPSSSVNVGNIFGGIAVVVSFFLAALLLFVRKR